jgi:hypothetical protein
VCRCGGKAENKGRQLYHQSPFHRVQGFKRRRRGSTLAWNTSGGQAGLVRSQGNESGLTS